MRLLFRSCGARQKAVFSNIVKENERSLEDDLDAPISSYEVDSISKKIERRYKFVLRPMVYPTHSHLGRLVRESKSAVCSFIKLSKVRSLIDSQLQDAAKRQKLGNLSISYGIQEAESDISGIQDFISRLELLTNAYALSGNFVIQEASQENFQLEKLYFPYQAAVDYVNFCKQALKKSHISSVIYADEEVRKNMVNLVINDGKSLGEALLESMREKRSLFDPERFPQNPGKGKGKPWEPKGGKGLGKGKPWEPKGAKGDFKGKGPKGLKIPKPMGPANALFDWNTKRKICKNFNDNRGCTNADCKLFHVCDKVTDPKTGRNCGATDHCRRTHT